MRSKIYLAAATALLGATALHAQAAPSTEQPRAATPDPNERICEDIVQTGSRIAAKRFCGTRAQWEDKKRQDREAVEKAQLSPCVITRTGNTGRASC